MTKNYFSNFHYWVYNYIKEFAFLWQIPLILTFLMSLFFFILTGCTSQPVVQTQEVYIPTKCNISMPHKFIPQKNTDVIDYALELTKAEVAYRMELENALKFCIGEDNAK